MARVNCRTITILSKRLPTHNAALFEIEKQDEIERLNENERLRFQKNKAGYTAQDAPSTRLREGVPVLRTDGRTRTLL